MYSSLQNDPRFDGLKFAAQAQKHSISAGKEKIARRAKRRASNCRKEQTGGGLKN
jgi:hypothetical protein